MRLVGAGEILRWGEGWAGLWAGRSASWKRATRRAVANPGGPGQVRESRALVGVLRKILRGGGNDSGLGVGAWSCAVRLAAFAGAIAGLFRRGRGGAEGGVLSGPA